MSAFHKVGFLFIRSIAVCCIHLMVRRHIFRGRWYTVSREGTPIVWAVREGRHSLKLGMDSGLDSGLLTLNYFFIYIYIYIYIIFF